MDNKKILLVNLSKGRTGDLNSKLLGMVFVMKFQAAAMSRADIPNEADRVDFSLYVDEFQNFSTDSFATIMSEARKYHLNLIVANQFTTQLTQEIRDAVFGNMGTIVAFRIGQNDIESIVKYFQPTFDGDDLLRIPNFNTIVRTMIGGVPTQPFSMITLPSLGTPNPRLAEALKQLSAAKYGQPRAVVEKEINERMTAKVESPISSPAAPFGSPAAPLSAASPAAGRPAAPPPVAGGGSFLDEWLAKRRGGSSSAPTPAIKQENRSVLTEPSSTSLSPPTRQPFEPTAVPLPPAAPTSTQNISSEQIEQKEVDSIANELKQELATPETSPSSSGPTAGTSTPTAKVFEVHPEEGDTIVIDRDGSFRSADSKAAD
jgi:hypothetical protein